MTDDAPFRGDEHTPDASASAGGAVIYPLLEDAGNRRILREWLTEHDDYCVADTDVELGDTDADLCLVDQEGLEKHTDVLRRVKSDAKPVLFPVLLLLSERATETLTADPGTIADNVFATTVDEIVSLPIRQMELEWRIRALVRLRNQSFDLYGRAAKLRRFREAVEESGHGVYITDADGTIEYVNPAFEAITGYSAEEVIGNTPRTLSSGEMSAEYFDALWETVLSGDVWEEEIINRRKNGELYTAHQTIAPITEDGTIRAFVAVQTDISDRKERIAEVKRLSEYRQLRSRINQLLVTVGRGSQPLPKITETISASDRFGCTFLTVLDVDSTEFICESGSELTQQDVEAFHTDDYIEKVTEAGTLHIEDVTTSPFEQHVIDAPSHEGYGLEISHKGTTYGILTVHFPPDEPATEDEIQLLEEITDDIGLFRHTEETEAERRTFAEIVQRLDDPIMLQDRSGRFQVVNDAVTEYASTDRERLLGDDETAFMDAAAADYITEQKRRVMETERALTYEVTATFPEKGERELHTTRFPHYDLEGKLDGTVAICRDVTELKERERHLRVFARVLRHNLRSDMNVVLGNAEMILEDSEGEHAQELQRIIEKGNELLELAEKERRIVSVLSEPSTIQPIDLQPILDRIQTAVTREFPEANVTVNGAAGVQIRAVPEIEDALFELIENGVKHQHREEPAVTVDVREEDDTVTIQVKDRGPKIPEMERKVLLGEADISSLYHGSGLGLWLVKHIVTKSERVLEFKETGSQGNIIQIN